MYNSRIFVFILSFSSFFLSASSSKPEPSSILYDFTGTCEGKFLCLPYSKITFASIWDNSNTTEIIEELNKELENDKDLNKKLVFKESRFKQNEIVSIKNCFICFLRVFLRRIKSKRTKSLRNFLQIVFSQVQ